MSNSGNAAKMKNAQRSSSHQSINIAIYLFVEILIYSWLFGSIKPLSSICCHLVKLCHYWAILFLAELTLLDILDVWTYFGYGHYWLWTYFYRRHLSLDSLFYYPPNPPKAGEQFSGVNTFPSKTGRKGEAQGLKGSFLNVLGRAKPNGEKRGSTRTSTRLRKNLGNVRRHRKGGDILMRRCPNWRNCSWSNWRTSEGKEVDEIAVQAIGALIKEADMDASRMLAVVTTSSCSLNNNDKNEYFLCITQWIISWWCVYSVMLHW